jgi:hypothetical protein
MMVPHLAQGTRHSGSFSNRAAETLPTRGSKHRAGPTLNLSRRCNVHDFRNPKQRFDDIERSSPGEESFLCATYYKVLLAFLPCFVCFTYSLFCRMNSGFFDSHWTGGWFVSLYFGFLCSRQQNLLLETLLKIHQQRVFRIIATIDVQPTTIFRNSGCFDSRLHDFHNVYEERLRLAGCFLAALP